MDYLDRHNGLLLTTGFLFSFTTGLVSIGCVGVGVGVSIYLFYYKGRNVLSDRDALKQPIQLSPGDGV